MPKLISASDRKVIAAIAKNSQEPTFVTQALAVIGKPIQMALDAAPKAFSKTITTGVGKGLKGTVYAARLTFSERGIVEGWNKQAGKQKITKYSDLRSRDCSARRRFADSHNTSGSVITGATGSILGLATSICEIVPGAQAAVIPLIAADVSLSMTTLTRHVSIVGSSFGYSAEDSANIPHFIASMAPITTQDEGYLAAKSALINQARAAASFIVSSMGAKATENAIAKAEIPGLIRLIENVAARLGVQVTQKELLILLPAVNAVLNGGLNVAFQRDAHRISMDYFSDLSLREVYGDKIVDDALGEEIAKLVSKKRKTTA